MIAKPENIKPLETWKKVYFLGAGGIGMSALARYLLGLNIEVSGYDRTPTKLTDELISEGIDIHFDEDVEKIPQDINLVVFTPAIPENNKEFISLKNSAVPMIKRAELLGLITRDKKLMVASGTHGKTSVSSMLAHVMHKSSMRCNAILGGIAKNISSNLILEPDSDFFVTEADEFDRSFLQLNPDIAIITSVDADHLDVYQNYGQLREAFTQFTGRIKPNGKLIIRKDVGLNLQLKPGVEKFSYSIREDADFQACNIKTDQTGSTFSLRTPFFEMENVRLGIPGLMNVENAVAATAAALLAGAEATAIAAGLSSFTGVRRRFDYRIITDKLVFIDDYAHHPQELDACIGSVKNLYPGRKICGIFQPHLFSRTRDFADEFARSLEALDQVILLPIYPAREVAIAGVNSQMLFQKINHPDKHLCTSEALIPFLRNQNLDVVLTLGAGDIDKLVEPIENLLKTNIL